MPSHHVVFSHGKESGPWGSKIAAMAEVARSEGYEADSVDYRGVEDPHDRMTRLLSYCRDLRGDLVLVGSSLGGHVATSASSLLRAPYAGNSTVHSRAARNNIPGHSARLIFRRIGSGTPERRRELRRIFPFRRVPWPPLVRFAAKRAAGRSFLPARAGP